MGINIVPDKKSDGDFVVTGIEEEGLFWLAVGKASIRIYKDGDNLSIKVYRNMKEGQGPFGELNVAIVKSKAVKQ